MAATLEPRSGTQPYVECDEFIDIQLSRTQSQIKTTEMLLSASVLCLATLAYVLTFVVLDQWIIPGGFSFLARSLWLAVLVVGGGSWLIARILVPWFRTVHELYAAKMIESADPTLKSSVLNLVDMQMHGGKSASPMVLQAMEKRAAVQLSKVDVDHAIDRKVLMRLAYALLAMVSACCLYVLFSPKDAFSSVQRLLLPAAQTDVATETSLTNITPEDARLVAGESLTVEVDVLGKIPPDVKLFYTTENREFVDQPVDMQRLEPDAPRFRGVINGEKGRGLMQSIAYRIEAGDARTREFKIDIVEPPSSQVDNVNYIYPAYMKLDPKNQPGGTIDGWEGTKVSIAAVTSIPVESALLVFTETDDPKAHGEEIRMAIRDGRFLTCDWNLEFRKDGTFARYYHIECTTAAGESDPQPTVHSIKITPDQRPDVSLLHPTTDLERPANATIPLLVKAADPDFQLRFVTLRVEREGMEIHSAALLDTERPTFEGTHDLKLESLQSAGVKPGDELLYWIEARDNKHPHGNRSTTPRMKIKVTEPAKAEDVKQQLQQDLKQQKDELERQDAKNQDGRPEPKPEPEDGKQEEKPKNDPMKDEDFQNKPGDPKDQNPAAERQPNAGQDPNPRQNPDKPDAAQPRQPGENAPEQQPGEQQGEGAPKANPGALGANQPGGKKNDQKTGKQQDNKTEKTDDPDQKSDQEDSESGDSNQQNGLNKSRSKKPSNNNPSKRPPAGDQEAIEKAFENLKKQDQEEQKSNPAEDPKNSEEQSPETKENEQTGGQSRQPNGNKANNKQPQKSTPKTGSNQPDGTTPPESGTSEQSENKPDSQEEKPSTDPKTGRSQSKNSPANKRATGDQKTSPPDAPQKTGNPNEDTTQNSDEKSKPMSPQTGDPKTSQRDAKSGTDKSTTDKKNTDKKTTNKNSTDKNQSPGSDLKNDKQSDSQNKEDQPTPSEDEKPNSEADSATSPKSRANQKPGMDQNKRPSTGPKQANTPGETATTKPEETPSDPEQTDPKDAAADSQEKDPKRGPNSTSRPMNQPRQDADKPDPKAGKTPGNNAGTDENPMPDASQNKPANDDNPMPTPGEAADQAKPGDPKSNQEKANSEKANADKPNPEKPQPGKAGKGKTEKDAQRGAGESSAARGENPMPEEDPKNSQPGTGTKPNRDNTPKDAAQNGTKTESDGSGEPMPAEEDPNAEKRQATGKETGTATGQDKPEDDAPMASSDVKKAPNSKPGAMKPSKQNGNDATPQADSKTPKQPGANQQGETKTKPDGSANPEEVKPGTGEKSEHPREKRPGSDRSQNEPDPGRGRANQKSQKSDSGENGGGTPQDQGTEGSKEEGTGDEQQRRGDKAASKPNNAAKPGEKPGRGSSTRPNGRQQETKDGTGADSEKQASDRQDPSSKEKSTSAENSTEKNTTDKSGMQKRDANSGDPKQGQKPGAQEKQGPNGQNKSEKSQQSDGQSGQESPDGESPEGDGQSDKPGSTPGKSDAGKPSSGKGNQSNKQGGGPPRGQSPTGGNPSGKPDENSESNPDEGNEPGDGPGKPNGQQPNQMAPSEQEQADQEAAEKANEEFARKASNLVLKKLKKDADRGEVDQKLLDELGWTKDDMHKFVQRLEKQLQESSDESTPESEARRKQFEETLKAVGLSAKTKKKTAKSGAATRVGETGARRIQVPSEYQELYEEYNKELAKPTNGGSKK